MSEIIDKFFLELNAEGLSERRINKYKNLIKLIEKALGKKIPENNDDVIKILAYIEKSRYKYNTKISYKWCLKKFLRWLNKRYGYNFDLSFKVGDYRSAVTEKDLFTEEEVQKLINSTDNVKFKFAIMFLYETGVRVGELLNIKIGDIKLNDRYATIEIFQPKTKEKKVVFCFLSFPYLLKLLQEHPFRNNPDAYLLLTENNEKYRIDVFEYIMKKIFKKAGVRWRRLHNFRHTRATQLLRENVSAEIVKKLMGWKKLEMLKVYSHLTYQDVENLLKQKYGLNEQKVEQKTIICPNCGFVNFANTERCHVCNFKLKYDAKEVEELKLKEEILEILSESIEKDPRIEKILIEILKSTLIEKIMKKIK